MVQTSSVSLQYCIIVEAIRELANMTGVDIQTLRNNIGPPGNISNYVGNNSYS
jgi:hypothetical protein